MAKVTKIGHQISNGIKITTSTTSRRDRHRKTIQRNEVGRDTRR